MEKLRKVFVASVMMVTVLSMSMVVVPFAGAATASAGDLIKMNGLSSVYYLGADGKRYVFPNEQSYFSWYGDFSSVKTIAQSELESYPLGANVTMRPGTKLVKITTDPKVYAVEPNGSLVWLPSETVASTLWGADWAKKVVDVPDAFFTNYKIATGRQVAATAYPTGSLVKWTGADVYYIDADGKARKVASEAAFTANRFNWNNVITAPASVTMPTAGADITGAVATITDTSSGAGGTAGAGTGLTVAIASDSPAAATTLADSTAADGAQALIPVTKVNFTAASDGAVKVTTLKFKRGGVPSADADFAEFYLYEGNTLLAKYSSISSGVLTFTNAAGLFTVAAGTTKGVTLKVNLTAGTAASKAYNFAVNAAADVTTDGAAVSGSFPISGSTMTSAAVSDLGKLTLTSSTNSTVVDPGTNVTVYKFTGAATDQDISIERLKFTLIGTASATDLANFKLDVAGVQLGTTIAAMDAGKTVTFDLATPYKIEKGNTKTFTLKADVVSGTSRTYKIYIYDKEDVAAKDLGYNVYITPNQNDTYTRLSGSEATIQSGSLTVSKNTTSPSGTVALGATNVEIAKFDFKATGEPIKVDSISASTTLGTSGAGLYQVKLYVDGGQIGTSKNLTNGTAAAYSIGNSFIVPAGQTKTLIVKADLKTAANGNLTAGETLSFALSSINYTKQTSGGAVTGAAGAAANTLTVRSGTVAVTKNASFGDRSATTPTGTVNASAAKIGSFVITAGSGEAVDVTQITLKDNATTQVGDNFQNMKIMNGTTQIGNTISSLNTTAGTYDFTPTTAIRIAAGAQYVVDVYADIKSSVADAATLLNPVVAVDAVTATGIVTSQDASYTTDVDLQKGYIASSGGLTIAIDPDTTLADELLMGSTDNEVAKFKLTAGASEPINISEIIISDNTSGAGYQGSITNLSLYDGATKLAGPVQFESTATSTDVYSARFNGLSLVVPASGNKVLTLKADVSTADAGATSASTHVFEITATTGLGVETINANGASSGTTLTYANGGLVISTGTQAGNTFTVYKTKLTAAWASDTPSGLGAGSASQIVGKINITNTANVGSYTATVKNMNVTISSTISNTAARNLKIYKDSVSGTALATSAYPTGAISFTASHIAEADFTNVEIASGATKTFFVVLDTSDAASSKNLSIYVDAGQISWNDGVSDTTAMTKSLPLSAKTMSY